MKKIHRFIFDADLRERLIVDDAALLHQWGKVLKLAPGEEIEICDGRGNEALYAIEALEKKSAELGRKGELKKNEGEPARHVTLYVAVLKKEHVDLIVQKATECGAAEIVPIVTERTVKKGVKLERLREIAKEAAEQSGRGRVPTIHEPLSLKAAFAHADMNGANYFFHTNENGEVFAGDASSRVGLFIGPEGGWTDAEAKAAAAHGCGITSLGPRILRGETAAIVSVFLATK